MAVAVKVDEAQVGIIPIDIGQGFERSEVLPIFVGGALEKAGSRPGEGHQVELSIACQVEQFLPSAGQGSQGRFGGDLLQRAEMPVAQIMFIEPGFDVFDQDA